MRILRFIVDGETIAQDPSCDFTGLFPERNPNIRAEFVFSPEWKNRVKVAAFRSILDREYDPQLVEDDNTCAIPIEALARPAFKIQVLGKYRGRKYQTNHIIVYQRGGAK